MGRYLNSEGQGLHPPAGLAAAPCRCLSLRHMAPGCVPGTRAGFQRLHRHCQQFLQRCRLPEVLRSLNLKANRDECWCHHRGLSPACWSGAVTAELPGSDAAETAGLGQWSLCSPSPMSPRWGQGWPWGRGGAGHGVAGDREPGTGGPRGIVPLPPCRDRQEGPRARAHAARCAVLGQAGPNWAVPGCSAATPANAVLLLLSRALRPEAGDGSGSSN